MRKKQITFQLLYANEREYGSLPGEIPLNPHLQANKVEVLWSASLQLVLVTERVMFERRPKWSPIISSRTMRCISRAEALRAGLALVELIERYHETEKAGNADEHVRCARQIEAFGDPRRWWSALGGEEREARANQRLDARNDSLAN